MPAITGRLVDYIRCDVIRIGGITEARKIAVLAETYDVKTAWHGPNDVSPITHAVNWHLNVSEYNFGIQEDGSVDTLVKQVVSGGPVYRDGYLYLEDRPGIGCDIDEAAAEKYPFRRAYIPVCRSSDGALPIGDMGNKEANPMNEELCRSNAVRMPAIIRRFILRAGGWHI